ncbi:MAG: hypothetical protein RLZZ501_1760 [Pseudomonadota bacterium]|jgi:tetratricopeptide (TPR) repeat protein
MDPSPQEPSLPQKVLAAALILRGQNRRDEARRLCGMVLDRHPDDRDALTLAAVLGLETDQFDPAADAARKLLALDEKNLTGLMTLGFVARRRGHHDEAVALLETAALLAPDQPEIQFNLALCYDALGRHGEAEAALRRELALNPAHALAWNDLGTQLSRDGASAEAEECFRAALQHRPDLVMAQFNLGNSLRQRGAIEDSVAAYQRTLELQPDYWNALVNLAVSWRDLGRLDRAEDCLTAALALVPDSPEAHFNLSQIALLKGDFATGWREYEARLLAPAPVLHRAAFSRPRWDGGPLHGRTLLLHTEQGLGDLILALRFLPRVAAAGGRILLELPPPLVRLARRRPEPAEVIPFGTPLPPYDCQLPLMSLPGLYVDREAAIPAEMPYLSPDPDEAAAWARRLAGPGKAVGLVWAGSPDHPADAQRSLPAATLLAAASRPGLRLFSLQRQLRDGDRALLDGAAATLDDLGPTLTDFAATAAAVAGLDLVIAVDTAVAHLAGALGKPVWLLLPFAPDWRWMLERTDSPWYPSLRLFRQRRRGEWSEPLAALSQALDAFAAV